MPPGLALASSVVLARNLPVPASVPLSHLHMLLFLRHRLPASPRTVRGPSAQFGRVSREAPHRPGSGLSSVLWYPAEGALLCLGVLHRRSCVSDSTVSTAVKAPSEVTSFQYVEACSVEDLEENPPHWKLIPGSCCHQRDWIFRRACCVPGSV